MKNYKIVDKQIQMYCKSFFKGVSLQIYSPEDFFKYKKIWTNFVEIAERPSKDLFTDI